MKSKKQLSRKFGNQYFRLLILKGFCLFTGLLSMFSLSAITLNENSTYISGSSFNNVWNAGNWTAFFSGSGSNSTFDWNSSTQVLKIKDNILLQRTSSRVELTIDGITVDMDGGFISLNFEVDQGESLTITNNCKFTSTSSIGFWEGFKIYGDNTISQFDLSSNSNVPPYYEDHNASTVYNTDQTILIINGNSKIDHAMIGIHSIDGAILIAEGMHILDCQVGIKIQNYTHPTAAGFFDLEYRNASYLRDVHISLDERITGAATYATYYAVQLLSVYGIHVSGCYFNNKKINEQSTPWVEFNNCDDWGYGIYAFNSVFSVHPSGAATLDPVSGCVSYDGDQTYILYFSFGIQSSESAPTIKPKFAVQDTKLLYNYFGIMANGGSDYVMKNNEIQIQTSLNWATSPVCVTSPYGIFMNQVGSFAILNNWFISHTGNYSNSGHISELDHIKIANCGDKRNLIRGNTFTGANLDGYYGIFESGIHTTGNNSNTEPYCGNSFNRLYYGIYFQSGTLASAWTVKDANDKTTRTLNSYSSSNGYDLYNTASFDITYYESLADWGLITNSGLWTQEDPQNESGGTCSELSCTFYAPLSSKPVTEHLDISMYPNPNNPGGLLTINVQKAIKADIIIYNNLGQIVLREQIDSDIKTIELNKLKSGTYFVVIKNESFDYHKILIVN